MAQTRMIEKKTRQSKRVVTRYHCFEELREFTPRTGLAGDRMVCVLHTIGNGCYGKTAAPMNRVQQQAGTSALMVPRNSHRTDVPGLLRARVFAGGQISNTHLEEVIDNLMKQRTRAGSFVADASYTILYAQSPTGNQKIELSLSCCVLILLVVGATNRLKYRPIAQRSNLSRCSLNNKRLKDESGAVSRPIRKYNINSVDVHPRFCKYPYTTM